MMSKNKTVSISEANNVMFPRSTWMDLYLKRQDIERQQKERDSSILPDIVMNLPTSDERMNFIQSHFKINQSDMEAYENIVNQLTGKTLQAIRNVLEHAKSLEVNDKIKLKRTFWQKVLIRRQKYHRLSPETILFMKVERALKSFKYMD